MKYFSQISAGKLIKTLFWLGLFVFFVVSFSTLKGGIVLGEPDEVTHQELVDNFHQSLWPKYSGGPWYYELPLFPFLGFIFSFFLKDRFVALRTVSLLSSVLLVYGVYFYLKNKATEISAILGVLILAISPFFIFYSRIGMLDASVISFSFLSFIFFDLAVAKNKRLYFGISGFFLAVGFLVKYSALIFLVVPVLYFLFNGAKRSLSSLRRHSLFSLDLNSSILFLIFFLLVAPVFLILYLHDRYLFKLHLLTNLGLLKDFWWLQAKSLNVKEFLGSFPWWLTVPIIVFSVLGFFIAVRQMRRWPFLLIYLCLSIVGIFYKTPFYPRYVLLLVPFLSVLCAIFLDYLYTRLRILSWSRLFYPILTLSLLFILPTSIEAFRSTRHNIMENTSSFVLRHKAELGETAWLFSTYWPNFFRNYVGNLKVGWVADSAWETSAFAQSDGKSSLDILRSSGGVVVVEQLYSQSSNFQNPVSRINGWAQVEEDYKPTTIIYDRSPNFPHFRNSLNSLTVYIIKR